MCGGYQMLGRTLHDPHGIEGPPGTTEGLGLLDVETTFLGDKHLAGSRAGASTARPSPATRCT